MKYNKKNLLNEWNKFIIESATSGVIVAFYGPTGSGKSTIRNLFHKYDKDWVKIKSYTTRQVKPDEADEYQQISKMQFDELDKMNKLINVNKFIGASYGIDKDKLKEKELKHGVIITDASSIPQLKREVQQLGKRIFVIYVTADRGTLETRQSKRIGKRYDPESEEYEKRMDQLNTELDLEKKRKLHADEIIFTDKDGTSKEEIFELADKLKEI